MENMTKLQSLLPDKTQTPNIPKKVIKQQNKSIVNQQTKTTNKKTPKKQRVKRNNPTKKELEKIKQMEAENRAANEYYSKQNKQKQRLNIIRANYAKQTTKKASEGILNENHKNIPSNMINIRPINQTGEKQRNIINKINMENLNHTKHSNNENKAPSTSLSKDKRRVVVIKSLNNYIMGDKKIDDILQKMVAKKQIENIQNNIPETKENISLLKYKMRDSRFR